MAFRIELINRILSPEQGDLSPELAKYFLGLDFTESERDRCEELSYKAQEGNLSLEEGRELDCYLCRHFPDAVASQGAPVAPA